MKRILGILVLLFVVYLATWIFSDLLPGRTSFMTGFNHENLIRRTSLYGILGVGAAFVIITGGIDLSLGSVVCLVGVGFPWIAVHLGWPLWICIPIVILTPILIGLAHGLLVTKMNLQPFIVTLCGLMIYRGVTRGFTKDQSAGFGSELKGLRFLANGEIPITSTFGIPIPTLIFIVIVIAASILLNKTVFGMHLLALGNNEEAAKFSGINTNRVKIGAYILCSGLAGLGGLLFILDNNSAQPVDFGNFYEVYAIAAAVLGGCSLRGGSGTITGIIVGTALIQVLRNMIVLVDEIPQTIELAVVGTVILAGAIGDEIAKRVMARRHTTI